MDQDLPRDLLRLAKERHYVYQDQPEASLLEARYPEEFETTVVLRDGVAIFIRPVKPTDEPLMRDLFYSFSQQTVLYRFFSPIASLPHQKVSKLVNIDYDSEMTLVAGVRTASEEKLVGSASYFTTSTGGLAEFAVAVDDAWQNRGVGTALLNHLMRVARVKTVKGFVGYALESNTRIYRLMTKTGYPVETKWSDGVHTLAIRFEAEGKKP